MAATGFDRDFELQLKGHGLLTAQVFYFLPDYPSLIQQYVWQDYDEAPDYPILFKFLDHWRREIEAKIQSVRIAHQLTIGPREFRHVDHELRLQ